MGVRDQGRPWLALVVCLIVAALVMAGCGQSNPSEKQLTAAEIVQRSADEMAKLTAFHFKLTVDNGVMPLVPGMSATSIEGDAAAPDRLQLVAKARFGNTPVELQLRTIGPKQYLTSPLTRQWQDVSGSLVTPVLLAPDRGVGATIRKIERPELIGKETLDGVESYHLKGAVPAAALADLIGGNPGVNPVAVELWIGTGDFLLRKVKMTGAITSDEAAQLERTLAVSDFNKSVVIEPPAL